MGLTPQLAGCENFGCTLILSATDKRPRISRAEVQPAHPCRDGRFVGKGEGAHFGTHKAPAEPPNALRLPGIDSGDMTNLSLQVHEPAWGSLVRLARSQQWKDRRAAGGW